MSEPFNAPFVLPDLEEVIRVYSKFMESRIIPFFILLIKVFYAADVRKYGLYPRVVDGDFSHQIRKWYPHVETLQMMPAFEVEEDGGIVLERDPVLDDVGDVQAKRIILTHLYI